jgi:hypothetical protein
VLPAHLCHARYVGQRVGRVACSLRVVVDFWGRRERAGSELRIERAPNSRNLEHFLRNASDAVVLARVPTDTRVSSASEGEGDFGLSGLRVAGPEDADGDAAGAAAAGSTVAAVAATPADAGVIRAECAAAAAGLLLPYLSRFAVPAVCSTGRDEAASLDDESGINDEQGDGSTAALSSSPAVAAAAAAAAAATVT